MFVPSAARLVIMTNCTGGQARLRLSRGSVTAPWVPVPATAPDGPAITWRLRAADGQGTRPALEIYADGVLVDVLVATPLSLSVLGGGCRAARRGREQAVAWGRMTAAGPPVTEFRSSGPRGRRQPGAATSAGRWFWVAVADGAFTSVTASYPGGAQRRRLRRIRATPEHSPSSSG